jgi:hypothetical protein
VKNIASETSRKTKRAKCDMEQGAQSGQNGFSGAQDDFADEGDGAAGVSRVAFTYANLGQLKTAVGTGGQSFENLEWSYDAGWNMTNRTAVGGSVATYAVNDHNQVTADTTQSPGGFGYDFKGNMINAANNRVVTQKPALMISGGTS